MKSTTNLQQTYNKTKLFEVKDDGVTKTSELIEQVKNEMGIWLSSEIVDVDKNFPPVKSTRYFDREVEPQELGKSPIEVDPNGIGITFREYLILQLQYFKETGKYLDIKNWTWCSGSKFENDYGIRFVYSDWDGGRLRVHADDPGGSDPYLGCRLSRCIPTDVERVIDKIDSSQLESRIKNLEERLTMLESPKGFTASTAIGDLVKKEYYYISSKGKVERDRKDGANQKKRKEFGNYFETQQEALKAREKISKLLK